MKAWVNNSDKHVIIFTAPTPILVWKSINGFILGLGKRHYTTSYTKPRHCITIFVFQGSIQFKSFHMIWLISYESFYPNQLINYTREFHFKLRRKGIFSRRFWQYGIASFGWISNGTHSNLMLFALIKYLYLTRVTLEIRPKEAMWRNLREKMTFRQTMILRSKVWLCRSFRWLIFHYSLWMSHW